MLCLHLAPIQRLQLHPPLWLFHLHLPLHPLRLPLLPLHLEHATYQVYCYLYKFKSETFQFFGSFGWKEGLMDLRCKSQHVRTRQTMLRSGSAVFPGTAGKHSASAASGRQTSKEDPQRDNWKTLFESLF